MLAQINRLNNVFERGMKKMRYFDRSFCIQNKPGRNSRIKRIPSGDLNFTGNKDLLPGHLQSSPALSFGSLGNLLFPASTFSIEVFFFF